MGEILYLLYSGCNTTKCVMSQGVSEGTVCSVRIDRGKGTSSSVCGECERVCVCICVCICVHVISQ